MKMDETYTFDETVRIVIPEGLPGTKTALKQLEFALASIRARGGRLVKIIHDETLGAAQVRLRGELRRFLRVYKKEGRILLMIRGEDFSCSDTLTRYLIDKYPQVELDADMDKGNSNITVVCLN